MMMQRPLGLSLAFTVLSSITAGGAVIDISSRIDRVTVHPDAAIVTRVAKADVGAGSNQIVLRGLPSEIDISTIRVEAAGTGEMQILAIDDAPAVAQARSGLTKDQESKLVSLKAKQVEYSAAKALLDRRRAFITKFAEAPLAGLPDDQADPLRWEERWAVLESGLAKVAEDAKAIDAGLHSTAAQIAVLESLGSEAGPAIVRQPGKGRPLRDISIAVENPRAGTFDFSISYKVGSARWSAAYDAKLISATASEPAKLTLGRRARITQSTSEDWTNVVLSVSTTATQRRTAIPAVASLVVRTIEPPRPAPATGGFRGTVSLEDRVSREPADVPLAATEQQAAMDAAGFRVVFEVPGRVSIARDGMSRTILLQQSTVNPEVTLQTAPALDPAVYIEASFISPGGSPLSPGLVLLTRDSEMIGQGHIPHTPGGGVVRLGFGVEDRVQVSYASIARTEAGPSFMGSNKSDTREFKATLRNFRSAPVSVTVIDRIPISEEASVEIERLSTMTPGSEPVSEEKRGVVAWKINLAPGGENEIRTGYRVRWPADRQIQLPRR